MFIKNVLSLFDISCLSATILLLSLKDNKDFVGLFLKIELALFHYSLDVLFKKIFL